MIRGISNALVALVLASLIDKYFYDGRYTDAALSILSQVRHSLGL